jgi:hypothetical protein
MARQEATTTMCGCGRATIFTGRWSSYNAKNDNGKQICNECKMDAIYAKVLGDKS